MSKTNYKNTPPIAAVQLDVSLIDDEVVKSLLGEGINNMFQYFSSHGKKYRHIVKVVLDALSFLLSIGMGYPTPAMIALNIHVAKKSATKRKIALWLFYSTILPSLWDYFVYRIEMYQPDGDEKDNGARNNDTTSSVTTTIFTNVSNNDNRRQQMLQNMQRRRCIILKSCVVFISRILPVLRLVHYLQFIHVTTKLTSKPQSATDAAASIPPTLAMRIAGITYLTSSPSSSYYHNMSYSHQRMTWNHTKHFILQLGGEEAIRRIVSLLLPPQSSSSTSDGRRENLSWQRRLVRAWYQTSNRIRSWWPSPLTHTTALDYNLLKQVQKNDYNEVNEEDKHSAADNSSYLYCPICLTKDIRNPYEALPCHHVHCYMCLRMAAIDCITKAPQHRLNLIKICCLRCGTQILSSRRI